MTYTQRAAGILHRSGLVARDALATPAAPTTADITTGGVLNASTTYKATVAVATATGVSAAPAAASQATAADASNTHGVRVTIAQVVGALGYHVFVSTDAAPKWAGFVTEAQRAAGVAIRSVGGVGGDVAADVAGKIRTALAAHAMINAAFVVSGSTTGIILTDRTKRANDATLNIAIADDTSVGVAAAPTSANTTAGVVPVQQVETATLVGAITGAGNATITVTANGMANSPKEISVAVVDGDDASAIAGKIRAALTADVDVAAFFTVSGATTAVILTAKVKAANDATMNIAQIDGTSHGLTTAANSANTTAGVAAVAQVETATVGATGAGNVAITVTAAGMTNSPKTVSVAVANGDDSDAVAGKCRTALAADTDVNGFFVVSGATDKIILTARARIANDATINIASANGTAHGVTAAATSADTAGGVLAVKQVETATIVGTIDPAGAGNATIIVTAAAMTNSPKTVQVAVANDDTATQVAGKARIALALDADIGAFFDIDGGNADIRFTAKATAANDATMNVASTDGTCTGLTTQPTSADTTAGAAGTAQVETATIVATIAGAGAGNATVIVTAAGMANSPKTVSVAVADADDASAVGGKIRTALAADVDVNGFFVVSGATTDAILTARATAANDATLNISIANGTSLGVPSAPTSANTTAGVAGTLQVETATVAGAIAGAGNATVTVTADGMGNSPKAVSVAVVDGDNASAIAGKVRAALALDADVSAFFAVSGATDKVILTAIVAAANDATMNIASIDGTSHGVTTEATSADTTAGVAGTAQIETATVPTSLVTASGNVRVTVTGANLYNSPAVVEVAVSAAAGVAGSVDVLLAGTGVASTSAPFAVNNAYTPQLVTPIACAGFSKAYVLLKVKPTFAGAPSISLVHFIQNNGSTADFHQFGAVNTPAIMAAVVESTEVVYEVDVDGALGLCVLCEAIANATADVWVELA